MSRYSRADHEQAFEIYAFSMTRAQEEGFVRDLREVGAEIAREMDLFGSFAHSLFDRRVRIAHQRTAS